MVYLLSGKGGTYTEWTERSDVTASTAGTPVILVMPDGGTNATAGWYSDWKSGRYSFERYHLDVVMPYIDRHFRTLPGHDAVAGLSMGGFGALAYAARHPGRFRAVAGFSGLVDNAELTGPAMAPIWGDPVVDRDVWEAHNPVTLAPRLKGTRVLLAAGTGYPDEPKDQSGDEEMFLFAPYTRLLAALDAAGVQHSDRFYVGGTHKWPYWTADLHWALPRLMAALK